MKNRTIALTSIILMTILVFGGIAYAYFTALTSGDIGSNTIIKTGTLTLSYSEGIVAGEIQEPGDKISKEFSVENTGDVETNYLVYFSEVINDFVNKDELVYSVTCTSIITGTNTESGTCNGIDNEEIAPDTSKLMLISSNISPNITHKYIITFHFKETGNNQDYNQGRTFSTRITINEMITSIALKGYLYDGNSEPLANKTIEIHSDPISTTTDSTGYYEFDKVITGNHNVIIKDGNSTIQEYPLHIKVNQQQYIEDSIVEVPNETNTLGLNIHSKGEYLEYVLTPRPELTINTPSNTVESKSQNIIINVTPLGLGTSNDYQYYLSTSSTSLTGGSWINYENGKEFTIGEKLADTYYLFVKRIGDALGEYTNINDITINNVIYHRFGPYNIYNPPIAEYLRIDNTSASITKSVSGDTIKLYASVSGSPTQVCLSNSSTNNNCTWVSYNKEGNSYTLPSTTGNYTIYAWFKDKFENISSRVSATTTLYAPTDSSCFAYDTTSTSITRYYCSMGLTRINDVVIPTSITSIGESAFESNKLTSVIIPNSVTSIGKWAFYGNQLTSVTIGNSVTTIGSRAFSGNELTSVTIPDGVESIGVYTFSNNQLTSVTISDGVESIGNYAFEDNQLTSVTIPDSITSIGRRAFANNKLTSIDYPGGILMNGGVFNGNPIISDEPFYYYKNKNGTYDKSILIGYINDGTSSVIIPNTVKTVQDFSFYDENLTSVTISDGVESIGNYAFQQNQLTSVTIPNSVTTIGSYAFNGNNLTSVTIPNSVTTIGSNAFQSNKLTSVTIGNSVTSIGEWAFANNQLTSVTIGNSVTTIGERAFASNQLTSVTIPDSVTTIERDAFVSNQLTSVKIGSGVKTIGIGAFQSNKLTSVTIPNSVTTIENVAFQSNALTSVTIGNSVTSIGNSAFSNNQLTNVTIPSSVTSIGNSAFQSNKLTSVTIPNSVTTIGWGAFRDNQLTSVKIGSGVTSIGNTAFYKTTTSNPNLSLIEIDNVSGAIEGSPWGADGVTIKYLR